MIRHEPSAVFRNPAALERRCTYKRSFFDFFLGAVVYWFAIVYITQEHRLDLMRVLLLYALACALGLAPLLLIYFEEGAAEQIKHATVFATPLIQGLVLWSGMAWWLEIGTPGERRKAVGLYDVLMVLLDLLLF